MSTALKVTLAFVAVIVAIVGILAMSYVSAFNIGNRLEQTIKAQWDANRNTLSAYTLQMREAAQIPAMMADDMQRVVEGALDARYGEDGSRAMMQWIQEQNPSLSPEVYTQLQRMIEAGRKDFKRSQDILIDQKRVYETNLGSFWTGAWMRIAGYPKIDLDDYNLVLDVTTNQAFENGEMDALNLRGD